MIDEWVFRSPHRVKAPLGATTGICRSSLRPGTQEGSGLVTSLEGAEGRPTTAFVLAAGLGKRMRPLTDDKPKPMVALAGRPLIDHVLDRLAASGITDAVVNVHYKAEVLLAHLGQRTHPRISISDERGELLETGGGVVKARALLGPRPFLIHNSDTVWIERGTANISRLIEAWDPQRMDSLLLIAERARSIGYDGAGDFDLGADGHLSRRRPGTETPYVFAGVSIAHPRMLDGAPSGAFSLNMLWNNAIANGRLHGIVLDGLWMHVGTPEALIEAEERIAQHERA
jgi:MurNAc alpha-1-phosphate uridylyltransferase